MSTCCVCLAQFEGEDAPILMMDPLGNQLLLCPDCAALVDAIAGAPDSEERTAALAELAEIDVESPLVATELSRLINREDAPCDMKDAWEEEEAEALADAPTPPATQAGGSNLPLYLGIGCLAVAAVLFLILRFLV